MRDPQRCPAILIAEDECLFALQLEAWIEDCKMKPLGPVSSVQDAKDLLEEFGTPDAAILDIDLHGETIFPIAEILLAHQIPFIFVTGCALTPPAPFQKIPVLSKPTNEHLVLPLLHKILQMDSPYVLGS